MAKEYIEREAAIKRFSFATLDCLGMEPTIRALDVVAALKSIPAADVVAVVRGKWEVGGMFDDIGRCSNCHYIFPIDTAMTEFHFCPNCGADMRGETE